MGDREFDENSKKKELELAGRQATSLYQKDMIDIYNMEKIYDNWEAMKLHKKILRSNC